MAKTPAPNAFEHFDILDSIKPHTFAKPVTPDITEKTFFDPKHTLVRKHKPKLNQSILEKIRTHYNYKPLHEDEIRLLLLQPGEMEDDIYCTIVVKPLERLRKKYTALSYHWGPIVPAIGSISTQSQSRYPRLSFRRLRKPLPTTYGSMTTCSKPFFICVCRMNLLQFGLMRYV
jgi:hypothetical protein